MKTLLANVLTLWLHGIAVRFCRLITLQLCRRALAVVLVAGAILTAGCTVDAQFARWEAKEAREHAEHISDGHIHYYELQYYPSIVRSRAVLGPCDDLSEITEAAWATVPNYNDRYPEEESAMEHEHLVPNDYDECNTTGGTDRDRYLTFSSIQLDEDVISITAESEKAEWLDKYTVLVIAEKGKQLGFKYAFFAATENRDESVTTPLETKTTTSSSDSDIDLTSYVQGYYPSLGIGTSRSTSNTTTKTTTTGGETTTTYKRVHTVKFSNEKLPNAFNLEIVAKSIKGVYLWEIDL